jgi:hypothetical protein
MCERGGHDARPGGRQPPSGTVIALGLAAVELPVETRKSQARGRAARALRSSALGTASGMTNVPDVGSPRSLRPFFEGFLDVNAKKVKK